MESGKLFIIGLWIVIVIDDDDPYHLLGTHYAPGMVLSSLQGLYHLTLSVILWYH